MFDGGESRGFNPNDTMGYGSEEEARQKIKDLKVQAFAEVHGLHEETDDLQDEGDAEMEIHMTAEPEEVSEIGAANDNDVSDSDSEAA
jgi:hypothetical protein